MVAKRAIELCGQPVLQSCGKRRVVALGKKKKKGLCFTRVVSKGNHEIDCRSAPPSLSILTFPPSQQGKKMAAMVAMKIENDPYELATLAALESYVIQQLKTKEYDFEANKALLRSYQVNAEQVKLDTVVAVMILAVMRLPSTDFLALSYIIPGKLPMQPKLKQIQKFADLLERAEFVKFWEEYTASDKSLTDPAAGFVDAIRTFIVSTTAQTFRNISKDQLRQFLGFATVADVDTFCKTCASIDQVSGDTVSFVRSEAGQKSKNDEGLRLDEALRLVDAVRAGASK